jgi:hypothetical protein
MAKEELFLLNIPNADESGVVPTHPLCDVQARDNIIAVM